MLILKVFKKVNQKRGWSIHAGFILDHLQSLKNKNQLALVFIFYNLINVTLIIGA
jgi:hypothetical protein